MLKLIALLSPLLHKFDIDAEKLKLILYYKKLEISRKEPTISGSNRLGLNRFKQILFSNILYSIMIAVSIMVSDNLELSAMLLSSMIFMLATILIISDLSEILLSTNDKDILGSKAIKGNIINISKFFILAENLFVYILSLSLISLLIIAYKWGLFALLLMLGALFCIAIISAMTALIIYFLALKYYGGIKIQNFITYLQIILMLLVMLLQFSMSSSLKMLNKKLIIDYTYWNLLIIPTWYGSWFSAKTSTIIMVLRILSLILPLALLLFYFTYLAKNFEKYLSVAALGQDKKTKSNKNIGAKLLCKNNDEKTGYMLAKQMLKSDQKLRRMVLPIVFIPSFYALMTFLEHFKDMSTTLYFIQIPMMASLCYQLKFTGADNMEDFFKIFPHNDLYYLKRGAQKALIVNYIIPAYILILAKSLFFDGIPMLIFALTTIILTILLIRISSNQTNGYMYFTIPSSEIRGEHKVPQGAVLIMFILTFLLCIPVYWAIVTSIPAQLLVLAVYLIGSVLLYFSDVFKNNFEDTIY